MPPDDSAYIVTDGPHTAKFSPDPEGLEMAIQEADFCATLPEFSGVVTVTIDGLTVYKVWCDDSTGDSFRTYRLGSSSKTD